MYRRLMGKLQMISTTKHVLIQAVLLYAVAGIAASPVHAVPGGMPETKISRLNVSASGSVRVLRLELARAKVDPEGCTGTYTTPEYPSGQALLIRELDDSKASAQFLSMVQLAYATDSIVSFWIVGCTSSSANYWGQTWPMPADIYLRK